MLTHKVYTTDYVLSSIIKRFLESGLQIVIPVNGIHAVHIFHLSTQYLLARPGVYKSFTKCLSVNVLQHILICFGSRRIKNETHRVVLRKS